ncbi:MAG: T9SS type A sorting domain-containing protein [Bacteroidetes bacterium]|nr:T9SS type A sorting domain-containing protein [Bacteroidota bacterium]
MSNSIRYGSQHDTPRARFAAAVLLAAFLVSWALPSSTQAQPARSEVMTSQTSAIEFYASNYGEFGVNVATGGAGFFYPRGSHNQYMFGSGLWFGAIKNVNSVPTKLFFLTYNPNSGASWATPGERSDYVSYAPLYNSNDYDLKTGANIKPGTPPYRMQSWPLWLVNGGIKPAPLSPGIFVADTALRKVGALPKSLPAFMPGVQEQMMARFNDADMQQYELRDTAQRVGYPLGLQIQQNIYSWNIGRFQNVVLLQYDIINSSRDTLHDCVVAQASDPDIGNNSNDHVRYYEEAPELRSAYAWTDPEEKKYAALVMTLIEAPTTNDDGFIDNRNRMKYRVEGRIGTFPHWTVEMDPTTLSQRYDFMTMPDFTVDDRASDIRALLASTKFSMKPGDTAHYAMAYIVLDSIPEYGRALYGGEPHRTLAKLPTRSAQLEATVGALLDAYYLKGFDEPSAVPSVWENANGIRIASMPNPARDATVLAFALPQGGDASIRLTDALGRTVMERSLGHLEAGSYRETIDLSALPAGFYMAAVNSGGAVSAMRLIVTK